ncbi:neuropeptide FF receptor 1 [Biomphalaria pfeifferi]|uniref:Neuropeptide FF receptor 1 n=1 Tax=Biomphalaria pfeifferi TaxID=112525 RepID=A0AAD8BWQ3_BIOPF|nr:neuropeptide FF receptor 1 [Biomphalaria pfeifferi]
MEEIFGSMAEEGTKVEIQKVEGSDKWVSWIKPRKGAELPHYIQLRYQDDPRTYKVLVTTPGRRQQCWYCQKEDHWSNQCPTRAAPRGNKRETGKSQESSKATYATALKGVSPRKTAEEEAKEDGFTLVRKKKEKPQEGNKMGKTPPSSPTKGERRNSAGGTNSHNKLKPEGRIRSEPNSPTKKKRQRTLSSSSSSSSDDQCVDLETEEERKIEIEFPDSPTPLVIDEGGGGDPRTHSNS